LVVRLRHVLLLLVVLEVEVGVRLLLLHRAHDFFFLFVASGVLPVLMLVLLLTHVR